MVPRLAFFEDSAGAGNPDAAWVLRGWTSNSRYTRRDEQETLSARQAGLGRPEATRAAADSDHQVPGVVGFGGSSDLSVVA